MSVPRIKTIIKVHIKTKKTRKKEKPMVLKHAWEKSFTEENIRILEIELVEPITMKEGTIIKSNVEKRITTTTRTSPINFISIAKYYPSMLDKIKVLHITKELEHMAVTVIGEKVAAVLKRLPTIGFKKWVPIIATIINSAINVHVRTVVDSLRYVFHPRIFQYVPIKVEKKGLDFNIYVKTKEVIAKKLLLETMLGKTRIEEYNVLNLVLKGLSLGIIIDKPVIILAEKPQNEKYEYIEFLKRVLRELYRVYGRGLPRPMDHRGKFEDIKLNIEAEKHICVIDLDEVEGVIKGKKVDMYIMDRLRELYSQTLGYIVFYGSEDKIATLTELWTHIPHAKILYASNVPKPLELKIMEDNRIYNIANLMWGKIKDFKTASVDVCFDHYVVTLENTFYDKLSELISSPSLTINIEPSGEDEERLNGESILHYALKAFIVKYFIEYEKIPEQNIFTEHNVGGIIADIYVKHPIHNEVVVEVETLYGTTIPVIKLKKTIESRLARGLRVWIVVPNIQFIMFLRDIITVRDVYKSRYPDLVEFYTVDIYQERIVPLPEVINKIKSIIKS